MKRQRAGADSLAEDVLHTSWIKILQSINHACFKGPKACPRIHLIVNNMARDFHGKRVRRRENQLEGERAATQDPEALAQERELLVLLREMIDLVPGTYRQVIKLRFHQGFSTKEISRRLRVYHANVAVRMNRAITLLKRRFDARARSLPPRPSRKS